MTTMLIIQGIQVLIGVSDRSFPLFLLELYMHLYAYIPINKGPPKCGA